MLREADSIQMNAIGAPWLGNPDQEIQVAAHARKVCSATSVFTVAIVVMGLIGAAPAAYAADESPDSTPAESVVEVAEESLPVETPPQEAPEVVLDAAT